MFVSVLSRTHPAECSAPKKERLFSKVRKGDNRKTYQTPEEIGTAFAECARAIYDGQMKETPRGAYRGMKVSVVQKDRYGIEVILSGKSTTSFKIGVSTVEANASRLMEVPQRVAEKLASAESDLAHLHQEVKAVRQGLASHFQRKKISA